MLHILFPVTGNYCKTSYSPNVCTIHRYTPFLGLICHIYVLFCREVITLRSLVCIPFVRYFYLLDLFFLISMHCLVLSCIYCLLTNNIWCVRFFPLVYFIANFQFCLLSISVNYIYPWPITLQQNYLKLFRLLLTKGFCFLLPC